MATPHLTRSRRRSSGDGVRSARCTIAPGSSDPVTLPLLHNLHATACAVLCVSKWAARGLEGFPRRLVLTRRNHFFELGKRPGGAFCDPPQESGKTGMNPDLISYCCVPGKSVCSRRMRRRTAIKAVRTVGGPRVRCAQSTVPFGGLQRPPESATCTPHAPSERPPRRSKRRRARR